MVFCHHQLAGHLTILYELYGHVPQTLSGVCLSLLQLFLGLEDLSLWCLQVVVSELPPTRSVNWEVYLSSLLGLRIKFDKGQKAHSMLQELRKRFL